MAVVLFPTFFFVLGILASYFFQKAIIPKSITTFLSCLLLFCIGLKGGVSVQMISNLSNFFPILCLGMSSGLVIPIILFKYLKNKFGPADAAALAAAYGSVSAITFITAQSVLVDNNIMYDGFMVAVMAFMEIPAIVFAIYLYNKNTLNHQTKHYLFNAVLTKSILLLYLGLFMGFMLPNNFLQNSDSFNLFFKIILFIFLIDIGMAVHKQLKDRTKLKIETFVVSLLMPFLFGIIAHLIIFFFDVGRGNQILISLLVGSASYIAAPAAVRMSIPNANASLYLGLPLVITFPLNLIFAIPFHIQLSTFLNHI